MVERLFELSRFYLKNYNKTYKRYFLRQHELKGRFYILIGQRGIGKTTALIQHIMDLYKGDALTTEALYVPVDHTLVAKYSLYEIAENFYKEGIKLIFFDEIHKYSKWSRDLKSIYDVFPHIKILASGSSATEINKSSHDLSRRAVVYTMKGLSFREYLELTLDLRFDHISLETLVKDHQKISYQVADCLSNKNKRVLPLFRNYLAYGYYPYFIDHLDKLDEYYLKLEQDIRKTILSDSLSVYPSLSGASVKKILMLLSLLTESVPYTPDLNDLKRKLEIGDIRTLKQYLLFLEESHVVAGYSKKGRGFSELEKPDKLFLDNTNLIYALSEKDKINSGNLRETFFANALSSCCETNTSARGDFLVAGKYIFEVGGKNKGFSQIKGADNAYLALDDIEAGMGNKIPLWLFGFLY